MLLALLSGCSALRLAYGSAPELAYWWLDGYADFDGTQTPRVREAIGQWFAWHRRTQLPDYAALLQRAQAEALADTTPERACAWWSDARLRLQAGFDQALPALADTVVTLEPAQIAHLEAKYAKNNADFAENYLQPDLAERRRAGIERGTERAEMIYGRLDDAQRERVAHSAAASPFDPEVALAEIRARQRDTLAMLRTLTANRATRERALVALRAQSAQLEDSPREDYRRYVERLSRFVCASAAELHNSTSPAQRQLAVQNLMGWEADLRALAADSR